ncbi:hypothetical protein C8Q78DRAFT_1048843 [Trametes maxima]|nr:hypothetical protein C8Q78DRAFT_1048843 [Trametes maxima]
MTTPHSFSFSNPAMPGDAVSVLVLVENSGQMVAKWPEVRDSYLPILLENLRSADPSVQMEARWLTTSSPSPVATYRIMDATQCRNVPELILGQDVVTKISPAGIDHAIKILSGASRGTNATRHLVLVAATGPSTSSPMSEATPSGFDSWDEIALFLQQEYIRLHVILSIGAEMRTYHELFKRSLQLQSNSEVPAWFSVDLRKFSIRLSGRPQYVRSSVAPAPLIPSAIQGLYGNPSPPPLPSNPGPPTTPPTQGSPPPSTSPHHRKAVTSPASPRNRPRGSESSGSPPEGGGGGLVSYLQQMHGLTKKKSYGVKAPKKTYADMQLPMAGRPILPRLDVSQSDIYTYPSFDNGHGPEQQVLVSDGQPPPNRRHSADQLPPASLVARTPNDDRRARRRGPWLPIAPLVSSTPSSPTSVTSPGTLAALQSLASMTPRLPDFVTKGRAPPATAMSPTEPHDPYAAHAANMAAAEAHAYAQSVMAPRPADGRAPPYQAPPPHDPQSTPSQAYYYSRVPAGAPHWPQQGSVGASPASSVSAPSPGSHTSTSGFSDSSRQYSDYTYGSSPPSSAAATPLSISAPAQLENAEDQPFIITPEIVAKSDADMEEVLRSGALQASMTPALCSAVQTMNPATAAPMYASREPVSPGQMYYSALPPSQAHHMSPHEAAYPPGAYPPDMHVGSGMSASQMDGGWHYGGVQRYAMAPVPDYIQHQEHWYPS